jgi:hypothetical protein
MAGSEYFKYRNCKLQTTSFNAAGSPLTIAGRCNFWIMVFPISGSATLTVVDGGTLQLSGTKYISCFNTTVLGTNSVINLGTCTMAFAFKRSGNKTFAGNHNCGRFSN